MERTILHVDCNNLYASVECFLNPDIRHLPVIVCGDVENRHGIILAKNMLAKQKGIITGEAIWEAKQKCPDVLEVKAQFEHYMREYGLKGRVVSISVRDCELFSFIRQRKIPSYTNLAKEVSKVAIELFKENYSWKIPVRSMGMPITHSYPLILCFFSFCFLRATKIVIPMVTIAKAIIMKGKMPMMASPKITGR